MSVLQGPGQPGLHPEVGSECESEVHGRSEDQPQGCPPREPLAADDGAPHVPRVMVRGCPLESGQLPGGYVASWQPTGAASGSRGPGSQSLRTLGRIRAPRERAAGAPTQENKQKALKYWGPLKPELWAPLPRPGEPQTLLGGNSCQRRSRTLRNASKRGWRSFCRGFLPLNSEVRLLCKNISPNSHGPEPRAGQTCSEGLAPMTAVGQRTRWPLTVGVMPQIHMSTSRNPKPQCVGVSATAGFLSTQSEG